MIVPDWQIKNPISTGLPKYDRGVKEEVRKRGYSAICFIGDSRVLSGIQIISSIDPGEAIARYRRAGFPYTIYAIVWTVGNILSRRLIVSLKNELNKNHITHVNSDNIDIYLKSVDEVWSRLWKISVGLNIALYTHEQMVEAVKNKTSLQAVRVLRG